VTYVSLYRRFRPQTFTEVVGQDHVTRTLRNAIAAGRTSHAYLFCGPRGTGKTSVAKVLAKALNCESGPTPDPCCKCEGCTRVQEGRSMDVIEIDAASNRGIDEIRDLRERVKFAPVEERYKVYIIDEVHMLTQEAFNALLKTLEEPPERVVFILATTEPHRVLATILSRCQRFDFRRLTISELSGQILKVAEAEGIEIDKDAVRLIAIGAQGAARDALGLLEQCAAYTGGKIAYEDAVAALGVAGFRKAVEYCDAVISGDLAGALILIRELIDSGHDPAMFLRDVLEHFRSLMVLQSCGFKPDLIDVPETAVESLKRQAEVIPGALILEAINVLSAADSEMKYSASPQLTAEVVTIKLVHLGGLPMPEKQGKKLTEEPKEDLPAGEVSAKEVGSTGSISAGSTSTGSISAKKVGVPGSISTSPASTASVSSVSDSKADGMTPGVASKSSAELSLGQIQAGWSQVVAALKPGIEKTLYCEDGIPVELNEDGLVISFEDDVKKELASERRRKKSIQDAIEKVFGVRFAISFILAEEPHDVQFHLESGNGFSGNGFPNGAESPPESHPADAELHTECREKIMSDAEDGDSEEPEPDSVSGDNGSDLVDHEEELAENLRRAREAVREHPTVKAALSVFKGRVFKIEV
jgi:DNA polymerase-3 subunit gamma/tau